MEVATVNDRSTIWLQSDGTDWHQISDNKVPYEKIVIWAEESTNLSNNNEQWSYGNGDTGFIGIPLPEDWQAYAVSFHADNTRNNNDSVIMAVGEISGNDTFSELFRFTASGDTTDNLVHTELLTTPISVPAGTTLGFKTITENGNVNGARVAVWLRRLPN